MIISRAPGIPSSMRTPKISPTAMNQIAEKAPRAAVPASRPSTIAYRGMGAASRRSVNPISMSTASAIPPLLPARRVDWIIAPARMKSRNPSTCGNPESSTRFTTLGLKIQASAMKVSGIIDKSARTVAKDAPKRMPR